MSFIVGGWQLATPSCLNVHHLLCIRSTTCIKSTTTTVWNWKNSVVSPFMCFPSTLLPLSTKLVSTRGFHRSSTRGLASDQWSVHPVFGSNTSAPSYPCVVSKFMHIRMIQITKHRSFFSTFPFILLMRVTSHQKTGNKSTRKFINLNDDGLWMMFIV